MSVTDNHKLIVIIRHARPDDWTIIQKLNREVVAHDTQSDPWLDQGWPDTQNAIHQYRQCSISPNYCCLIAYHAMKPVGYLAGTEKKFDYRNVRVAEICHIGVTGVYRQQKVGKQLVDHFRIWAKKQGMERLYVNAYWKNTGAHAFYRSIGLSEIDVSFEGKI